MNNSIRKVQLKILEIMKFIDELCRENGIKYYIMGGTALGAVRHKGFIPWDDDLDIFMTPDNYKKFKKIFNNFNDDKFVLQEWMPTERYLEYVKIRMNGTTFIEENFKNIKNMHHGIYVDIMILHKCPKNKFIQKAIYYASKYVTLLGLSKRNWKPKNINHKLSLKLLKLLPNKFLGKICYKFIYNYEDLRQDYFYCYYITKAKFKEGLFNKEIFEDPIDIEFEDTILMAPTKIKDYLQIRYGDYMQLPSKNERESNVHAKIYDTEKSYKKYINM